MNTQKPKGEGLASTSKAQPANTNAPAGNTIIVPKKLDAASEALLGLMNGTLVGGFLTTVGSATYSLVAKKPVLSSIKNTQLGVVLGGTAAIAAINALVRTSHAFKHNSWCDSVDEKTSHLERLEAEKAKPAAPQKG